MYRILYTLIDLILRVVPLGVTLIHIIYCVKLIILKYNNISNKVLIGRIVISHL